MTNKSSNLTCEVKNSGTISVEDAIEQILKVRGIEMDSLEVDKELALKDLMQIYQVDKAAKRLVEAFEKDQNILIFGDYDCDGISATSILWRSFEFVKKENFVGYSGVIKPFLPNRFRHGYGFSQNAAEDISKMDEDFDLIVTVDCGIRDGKVIAEFSKETSCEFIVTDHHEPPENVEDLEHIVVHQLHPKSKVKFKSISGAFVGYLLMLKLFDILKLELPKDLSQELECYVGISTVADVMPLIGVNRTYTKLAINFLKQTPTVGLEKLMHVAKVDPETISAGTIGFALGPRLNAAGRLDDATMGLRALLTRDPDIAYKYAYRLENFNSKRRSETDRFIKIAMKEASDECKINLIHIKDIPEGINGLVASKVCEQTHKPTLIFSDSSEDGVIKASARSIKGVNIAQAIEACSSSLIKFGGHKQAAGLSLEKDNFEDFCESLVDYIDKSVDESDLVKQIVGDIQIDSNLVNLRFANALKELEPFGFGFKSPQFYFENMLIVGKKVIGKTKDSLALKVEGKGLESFKVLNFKSLEDVEQLEEGIRINIVGTLNLDTWNGRTNVSVIVKGWDFAQED